MEKKKRKIKRTNNNGQVNMVRTAAQDRNGWNFSVEALCDFWLGEN